ncbi:MAG: hypothetical protein J6A01_09160 [Proteobacteria bacterium]|nr:hypothetical protein [Pseudomonadota bacterium]
MKRLSICLLVSCFWLAGCDDSESLVLARGTNSSNGNTNTEQDEVCVENCDSTPTTPDKDKPETGCKATDCDGVVVCLQTDISNCGSCGHACLDNQKCVNSKCEDITIVDPDPNPGPDPDLNPNPNPDPDPNSCGGTLCNDICVDTAFDNENCGTCGHVCGAGMVCHDSACVCENSNLTQCAGVDGCLDLQSDNNHCGACNHACGAGKSCQSGICTCDDAGLSLCGETCIDLKTDNSNCGTCGNVCHSGTSCQNSQCVCDNASLTFCGGAGACVDLQNDHDNCGVCGNNCGEGKCISGSCENEHPGMHVINYARKYLFENSGYCTYDWYLLGQLPEFYNFDWLDGANSGYDLNCANFVGACLKGSGEIPVNNEAYLGSVDGIRNMCNNGVYGYHVVANNADAQPGDIWYSSGHAELIVGVEGDHFIQIGSNNFPHNQEILCHTELKPGYSFSSDSYDYQRVYEHNRSLSEGTVCSKR